MGYPVNICQGPPVNTMRITTEPNPDWKLRPHRTSLLAIAGALALAVLFSLATPFAEPARGETADIPDSLYNAHHPRLLFDDDGIPALYTKVRDGGYDDDAYNFIRLMVDYIYSGDDEAGILDDDYGMSSVPIIALATFLENPQDEATRTMGRDITMYLVDNYSVDFNDYDSSLRLRSLAMGYDCFFTSATPVERQLVVGEIETYIDTMTASINYHVRAHRPYLSNRSAMVAASLGLAAIVLDGETNPNRVEKALGMADRIVANWSGFLIDTEGAYNEGVLYAGWSMRHLAYYFAARKRYDGRILADVKVRKLERWLAYELLPEGNGKTNNLNDSGYTDDPLAQHHTLFDWAQSEWQSGLSAYMYEHIAGPYGWNWGAKADKAATALWNMNLTPVQPDSILEPSSVWEERGLYYYRSGWPAADNSTDMLLSFYSGVFQGGHAQEDQNHFTLQAFGAKFAIDHGGGSPGKDSESHNIVLIDGAGQHHAGSSIGTDGKIAGYVLGDWADFIRGDATAAYTTYSKLNNPGYPFYFSNWSWGYFGANPVLHARRDVIAVQPCDGLPAYVFIGDDIDKDGGLHDYQWRLHTADVNTVDTSGVETWITAPTGRMIIHAINPPRSALTAGIAPYNNLTSEPDSKLLTFDATAVNPRFAFLLLPGETGAPAPTVTRDQFAWGVLTTIDWGSRTDVLLINHSGGTVIAAGPAGIETDAEMALVRFDGAIVRRYLAAGASSLTIGGTAWVDVADGPLNVALSGGIINIDRYDADFVFYGPGVTGVRYRTQEIHFVENAGYLTPDGAVGIQSAPAPARRITASAYPNPFNPSTSVQFDMPFRAHLSITVYDALGRRVRQLAAGDFAAGRQVLRWDGLDDTGRRVPSGVYLLRIDGNAGSATVKLTVIK